VVIGADGVVLSRRGGDRVVPYVDIADVELRAHARLTLVLSAS
jgi:hypothetical protein